MFTAKDEMRASQKAKKLPYSKTIVEKKFDFASQNKQSYPFHSRLFPFLNRQTSFTRPATAGQPNSQKKLIPYTAN